MTCGVGILVDDGFVMKADTRANAGLDNISTYRKLHMFERPGESFAALAAAGNLSITQSIVCHLREGLEDPETGTRERLVDQPGMFRAAQLVGRAIRHVYQVDGSALEQHAASFDVSMLLGGQMTGREPRLFMLYGPAISSKQRSTRPFCRSASTSTASPSSIVRSPAASAREMRSSSR